MKDFMGIGRFIENHEKRLRLMQLHDSYESVAVKKAKRAVKRKSKGKQHVVHAQSLCNISDALAVASTDVITPTLQPAAIMAMLSNIFSKEFLRVRGILR